MGDYLFFTVLAACMAIGFLGKAPLRLALVSILAFGVPIFNLIQGATLEDAYTHFLTVVILGVFILTHQLYGYCVVLDFSLVDSA